MTPRPHAAHLALGLSIAAASLAGCSGPHTISGRVIEGPMSYIEVVDPTDPRLNQPGIPGALLHLEHRPGKLQHDTIDRELSDDQGRFTLVVDRFLAGAIDYDVALHAERSGLRQTTRFFVLPTDDTKMLLVMLAPEENPRYLDGP